MKRQFFFGRNVFNIWHCSGKNLVISYYSAVCELLAATETHTKQEDISVQTKLSLELY
jgi:hypothetical protein